MCRTPSPYKAQNEEIARILTSTSAVTSGVSNNNMAPILFQILCPDGNITMAAFEQMAGFTKKEAKLKECCNLSRIKIRPDDGRIYLIVKRKPITSIHYIGLVDKLYDHFFGVSSVSLEDYFELWMQWRATETSVSDKTIRENRWLWNSLLLNQDIVKQPLQALSAQDLISYFRRITKDRLLTRKRFNDLKSILNGILYLAVERGVIAHNCLRDINYSQFTYKAENTNITPYTENERLQVIQHLGDDFYSLAIKLDFHLVLRIGELKGLRWDDIQGDYIYIQRFVNDKNQIVEDIKGHESEGKRMMPLTPKALELLEEIRRQNPDSDYIFIRDGQPLSTVTFNRHLKKCCKELGISYRSSHKLRFSTASIMYKNGVNDTELQKLLGHTNLSTTHHYLRNITAQEETAEKMRAILG